VNPDDDILAGRSRFLRATGRLALAVAVVVSLLLPSGYLLLGWRSSVAALETEVEISSGIITDMINANPELWRYEGHRLDFLLRKRLDVRTPESRRIVDTVGNVIEETKEPVPWPRVTREAPLYESGRPVARIVVERSLRPLLAGVLPVVLLGLLLGTVLHAVLVMLVRELRRTLAELLSEKERAAVTLHAIGEAVISTSADGRVLLMNAVAERLTGWPTAEATGRPFREVFQAVDARTGDPLPDPLNLFREHRETESVSRYTLQTSRRGRVRRIADSAAPIRSEDGTLQGMVLVFRDVTAQHRMEEDLLKSQKLESVGTLAGGIAHDFNNILTAILGNISLAEAQVGPGAPAHARLAEAAKACQRARDLTSQLLTFSRGGAPVRKTGSISALVRDTVAFATAGAKARCEIAMSDDLWPVDIDEGQISQVVHNLVINAEQAMPKGGTITVRCENVVTTPNDGLPILPGRYVKVSVRDEGPGILSEHMPNLFDPYFTTKREGSGLGLSICFNVVKNHGGFITASSPPGAGAVFEFYLPASSSSPAEEAEGPEAPPAGAGRILVMDDEEVVLEVLGEMLRHLSYEPVFTKDGAEAIERYVEARAAKAPFAAVIMDLTVPGGMGGREAVARLLEIDPGARVIVSSGYSNDPVMADYKAYGFKGVVAKPYLLGTLASALSDVLSAPN
jgi:PAS domain S-box-containing protein